MPPVGDPDASSRRAWALALYCSQTTTASPVPTTLMSGGDALSAYTVSAATGGVRDFFLSLFTLINYSGPDAAPPLERTGNGTGNF